MKNEKRKTTSWQRFNRTPWGFYLLLSVVAWACIILGVVIGTVAADAEAPAPVYTPSTRPVMPQIVAMEPPADAPVVYEEIVEPEEVVELEEIVTPSEQDLETLALIIYQEAGGDACSNETRQMVGEVFLNRVASPIYPDTFAEVATQYKQYGRLYWTGLVWPQRAELPQEAHAVERAYDIAVALLTGTAERLLEEDVILQAEFPQGTEIVAEQDGLYFCR